ncbi:uncharacterized protein LY89DRAFT_184368 [Mollisia scopiformis]|uniref:Uncharacterized protein n=1 Tax=Mollisia scopiformis TaxID=149040 RepID=A0A194XUX6_MOLSC|nr:uncharacterized protein LY89DRAFT_184368 [Mollisia scopiformis]KUJ23512.1 hypothetical protein LY89DRAFT_184368 [Mollisia scopiformis]
MVSFERPSPLWHVYFTFFFTVSRGNSTSQRFSRFNSPIFLHAVHKRRSTRIDRDTPYRHGHSLQYPWEKTTGWSHTFERPKYQIFRGSLDFWQASVLPMRQHAAGLKHRLCYTFPMLFRVVDLAVCILTFSLKNFPERSWNKLLSTRKQPCLIFLGSCILPDSYLTTTSRLLVLAPWQLNP